MTWGPFWMFYECPKCGKKFRSAIDTLTEDGFGKCPICHIDGILVSESGADNYPKDANDYEDTAD